MNKHVESKMVEQQVVTYVSDDGTSFDDAENCRSYEHKGKLDAIKKIPTFRTQSSGPMDTAFDCVWYLASDEAEYQMILEYYSTYEHFSKDSKTMEFPCWVCFKENFDGVAWLEGSLTDYLKNHEDLLSYFKSEKLCPSCGIVKREASANYCSKCGKELEFVFR